MSAPEPEPVRAAVDPDVAAEVPGLELWTLTVPGGDAPTAPEVRGRLRELAGRWAGAQAIGLRSRPIPQAYRVAFRQLGVDPDETPTPVEQAVRDRMTYGGFVARGRVHDALLLAVVETGVPVGALDAALVDGELELRPARPGERVGHDPLASDVPPGRLVVADDAGPVAVLFEVPAAARAPTRATERCLLYAVRAAGVPELHVDEALWIAADALTPPGA